MKDKDYSEEEITPIALEKAHAAFQKCLSDEGYDAGYWDVRFTAWTLSVANYERMKRYEIEDEVKESTNEKE